MAIQNARPLIVGSHDDIERLQRLIRLAAWNAHEKIHRLLLDGDPMEVLYALKFDYVGHTPLTIGRPQRLTEQFYRGFKALTTLAAAKQIGDRFFPERMVLRLGYFSRKEFPELPWHRQRYPGPEVESERLGLLDAEVFSAVSTASNAALPKSCERMAFSPAWERYIFFHVPSEEPGRRLDLEKKILTKLMWRRIHKSNKLEDAIARGTPNLEELANLEKLSTLEEHWHARNGVQIWAIDKGVILEENPKQSP